ncbi:hypothetical protein [Muricoccus pecuniae]|uniref:Uncharacterized protein n=1 Tax=Muricoccus pecuniae TaxID=693023 RepID=A0A840Y722_9PROT|nr:hypothetical protein [Roseomonas pecuniae]MBB5695956.1 hypothetical protein [Roseomonas pecuniae]
MAVEAPPRNWTEALANTIFFDGLNSARYIEWLVDRSKQPIELAAPFIHEFTHHWCFNSLVGNATAFTELRLYAICGIYDGVRPYCARDYVAVKGISKLLRPLAEGMALFAEFDLESSRSGLKVGTPFTAAELCFSPGDGDDFSQLMLQALRRAPHHVDRKASIYCHDFEVEEGYLPGYILVKSLFGAMQIKVPGISSELFLAYLRCFFWEDPGFVAILAAVEDSGPETAQKLFDRFLHRMDVLRLATDLPDRLEKFWLAWSAKGRFQPGWSIFIEPEEAHVSIEKLDGLVRGLNAFVESTPPNSYLPPALRTDELVQLQLDLANLRQYTIIARTPLTVEKKGERCVLVLPGEHGASHRVHWPSVSTPAEGHYECFAIIPNFSGYMSIVLRGPGSAIFLGWIGHFRPEDHAHEIEAFVGAIDRVTEAVVKLRDSFEKGGYASIDSGTMRELLKEFDDRTLSAYLWLVALRGRSDIESAKAEISMLRTAGLRPIFDNDPLALRAAAAISLADSSLTNLHDFDFEAQISMVKSFWLGDEDSSELRRAMTGIASRDRSGLVIFSDATRLRVLL